ncbi:MAG: hypothetical protein J5793_00610, partial [Clostridia bacterium]|nr:hypothetical protein [Clostridia bacterium]
PRYSENIKNEIMRKQGKALRAEAEEEVIDGVSSAVIREMRKKLRKEVEAENPDLDSDEIDDIVAEMLTEKYIEEHFYDDNGYTEEEVELMIEERFNEIVNDMVYDRMAEVVESDKYQRDFEALQKSKEYQDDLNSMLEYDAPAKIEAKCDALIAAAIKEYTDRIVAEIESRVETAVNEFIAANKDGLEMTEDEILDAIGRKIAMSGSAAGSEEGGDASSEAPAEEGEGGETGEDGSSGYKDLYTSWYEFVFEAKLKKSYYSIFGEPKFG